MRTKVVKQEVDYVYHVRLLRVFIYYRGIE